MEKYWNITDLLTSVVGHLCLLPCPGVKQTRKNKTELTNKSSQNDDFSLDRPIALLNSILFSLICLIPQ